MMNLSPKKIAETGGTNLSEEDFVNKAKESYSNLSMYKNSPDPIKEAQQEQTEKDARGIYQAAMKEAAKLQTKTEKPAMDKPTTDLISEAKKYKTPEEFVNNNLEQKQAELNELNSELVAMEQYGAVDDSSQYNYIEGQYYELESEIEKTKSQLTDI